MMLVYPVTRVAAIFGAKVIPGGGRHVFSPVLGPFDVGFVAEHAGAIFPDSRHRHKGSVVKQLAVLDEKLVPQPGFQRLAGMVGCSPDSGN